MQILNNLKMLTLVYVSRMVKSSIKVLKLLFIQRMLYFLMSGNGLLSFSTFYMQVRHILYLTPSKDLFVFI